MDRRLVTPAFSNAPAEYNQRHMQDIIRALNDLVTYIRAPGLGRNTTTTLTNPRPSPSGLESGTIWDNGGFAALAGRDPINPFAQALQFDITSDLDPEPGQMTWGDFDGTVRLGMKGGAVVLEMGEEMFMRVSNDTGSLIEDGEAVGFAGVNGMRRIQVAPYLADGAANSLFFVGVATEDIPDGEQGFVTVYGRVRGIDTTGNPVSESWSVGDLLWAHPTIPGGLTKVKPTAPDNVISVAAVLAVDDTDGEIFVRPTIEQQQFYGVFAKTADQSPAAIDTAYPVTFDTTRISNGVEIGTPASRIVVPESGLYQVAVNVQLLSTSASAKNVRFWLRKNGTDVPDTTRIVTTNINNGFVPIAFAEAVSLDANEYIELVFASNATAVRLDAVAPTAFAPSAPAAVLELTQVQQ